jgi:hypothetical protein
MNKNSIAVGFTTLVVGFYCFICAILAGLRPVLLQQNDSSWGDLFSLGQLLVDLCLIPFAIAAFYYTLHEIRRSQEKADLYLEWDEMNSLEYTQEIKRAEVVTYQTKNISLKNSGNTPATIYQVTLEIPQEYGKAQMINHTWKGTAQAAFEKFTFTGDPHSASFPNGPQVDLGQISFREPSKLPLQISINYHVASEKSEYKSGKLSIDLKEIHKDEK